MTKKSGRNEDPQRGASPDHDRDVPIEDALERDSQGEERRTNLETVLAERDRLQDQLRRAMADLQNIRKRHGKEMEDARRRAIEALTGELLPVLDTFELALAAHEQNEAGADAGDGDGQAMVEGVRMVRSLLRGTLERHGLAELPALGEVFDPNVHEAVGVDPSGAVAPGHVSMVMQQGYTMGERVIRPAKVMVAAAAGDAGSDPAADENPSH